MKKIINLLTSGFLFLGLAHGLDDYSNYRSKPQKHKNKRNKNSQGNSNSNPSGKVVGGLDVGIEYYRYQEPGVMKISGPMMTFYGDVGYVKSFFKIQADGYFSTSLGANHYDGALQNNQTHAVTPYTANSKDWYGAINGKVGVTLFPQNKQFVFAYVGLGYRFLHNNVVSDYAYGRDQGYLYIPIGVMGEIPVKSTFSILGAVEYRFLIIGNNVSGFKKLGYDNNLHFVQRGGSGGRLSVGGKFYLSNGGAVRVKLYYDFWQIDHSNVVAAKKGGQVQGFFVEPKNNTMVLGASIGYVF